MWHASDLDIGGLEGAGLPDAVHSHMRRNVLIILGALALAWGVLALALGSASLKLGSSGSSSRSATSPACLPGTLAHTATLAGTQRRRLAGARHGHGQPARAGQLPRRARRRDPRALGASAQRSGSHAGRLRAYSQGDGASFQPDDAVRRRRARHRARRDRRGAGKPVSFGFRVDTPYSTAHTPDVPQRAAARRRLPELLHAARRAGAGDDRHRARPRSRPPATSSRPTAPGRVSTDR